MARNPNTGAGEAGWKTALAGIVTILLLAAFLAFGFYLLRNTDLSELGWSRTVYVFAALEAITFAAIGWLFGREVHRERAEQAEERAEKASEEAEGGRAIAANIKAKQAIRSNPDSGYGVLGPDESARQAQQALDELAVIAARYYPDVYTATRNEST